MSIKKLVELMPKIMKGVFKRESHKPNSWDSPLQVLQIFSSQRNALLAAICSLDSTILVAKFDMSDVKPYLSYHVDFYVKVVHVTKTIGGMVVDEGASTCVMAISYWRDLGSPNLVPSTTLLTYFDARSFSLKLFYLIFILN